MTSSNENSRLKLINIHRKKKYMLLALFSTAKEKKISSIYCFKEFFLSNLNNSRVQHRQIEEEHVNLRVVF